MKRQLFAIAMLTALTGSSLLAQTPADAKIPFDFAIGQKAMPAGDYRISCTTNGLVTVRELGGKHSAMTLTTPGGTAPPSVRQAEDKGVLVFQRYGDEYFLSGVWSPFTRDGLTLPAGTRQKELASRLNRPEAMTIAMRK
jgi:hypothetical protein